jgi:DNA-binding transcriptional MerR regulator
MRIGELAAQTGVTAKTIRFWELTGLLADPARTPSGYRDFEPDAVNRLEFIRQRPNRRAHTRRDPTGAGNLR